MTDGRGRAALLDYLRSARRLRVLREDQPLWTRHDGAGGPGTQLSSWSLVENLKRYVREAGIGEIHLHHTRHTFARMVAERSGYSRRILEALGLPDFETDFSSDSGAVRRETTKRSSESISFLSTIL